ncbi:MOG interacting and ectopic P-granules protein 1 isoform X2 [Cimex lectularius]|nr:MOG interacting and ectopic P-granules protein 1 isoform X2 [Cimex lectularius]
MNAVALQVSPRKHSSTPADFFLIREEAQSKMMESCNDCPERDAPMKQHSQEPPKDEVKLNGEINGSYEEEEDDLVDDRSQEDSHTNGEITSTTDQVPSQENGIEKMEMDVDVNTEAETELEEIENHTDLEHEAGHEPCYDEEEVSELMEADDDDDDDDEILELPAGDGSEKEVSDKEDYTGVDDSEVKDSDDHMDQDSENSVSEINRTESDSLTVTPSNGRSEEQTDKLKYELRNDRDREAKKIQLSKELEDLTKIGSRGSLEITLVKKEAPKDKLKKEEAKKREIDVVTIADDSKDSVTKTPEKVSEDDDCIEISPEKSAPLKKKKTQQPINVTPRRSSRNINKNKSYSDKDVYIEEIDKKSDDDIQEIIPTDPLADDKRKIKKTTIVVNDTKKLVEIAAGSKQNRLGKKEPTLVIIDTNSILSGKGPVPVSQQSNQMPNAMSQMSFNQSASRQGFSMVPVNVNAFQNKQMKSTPSPQHQIQQSQTKPVILPSLTDDMYVVEAPSFIVPYVYEKPPVTPLKDYVDDIEKAIKEQEKEEKRKKKDKTKNDKDSDKAKDETTSDKVKEETSEKDEEGKKSDKEKSDEKMDVDKEVNEETEKDSEKGMDIDSEEKVDKKDLKSKADDRKCQKEKTDDDIESDTKSIKDDKRSEKSDTETDDEGKDSDSSSKKDSDSVEIVSDRGKRSENYFENPLGKFFMQIGVNLVQEHVQTDLLRNQKRKQDREGKNCPAEVQMAIDSLLRTLEFSKENNKPYKLEMQKCKLCNFKTESALVMAHHLETPHMRNYVYRCNFCNLEVRSPHDILFHMEAEHNVRGRLERAPAYHQCPNCPFEDNQKGKLSRHLLSCAKKYKPERNQEPPMDWEPPAKIPRVRGSRIGLGGGSLYSASLAPRAGVPMARLPSPSGHSVLASRGRGRPPIYINRNLPDGRSSPHHKFSHMRAGAGMVFRPSGSNAQPPVLLPSPYNNLYQKGNSASSVAAAAAGATAKLLQQPSISITPLPRQPTSVINTSPQMQPFMAKPGRPPGTSKSSFVICEICDGYIKDLEQLRNHMQWIHKVKIHPKMIYNRPPLNCQKCQFRFFTDQGLERHLLGSHGLVTSSMQEAANKGKDGGRCPVCGRVSNIFYKQKCTLCFCVLPILYLNFFFFFQIKVYQWKLLNHVARDHSMSLKPAHLSYKCTVCTATFGMYKQFENHVYSAHSVVAKRVMDKKPNTPQPSTSSSSQSDTLLKPLKINDEITIIPQPARAKTKSQPAPSKPAKV